MHDDYYYADRDHLVRPVSVEDDGIFDNCGTCGLACTSDGLMHGPDNIVYAPQYGASSLNEFELPRWYEDSL